jgi:ribosomal protein L16/L10AE
MAHPFGKSIGLAAQVKQGKTILEIGCERKDIPVAKLAAKRANSKFACPTRIIVEERTAA